MALAIFEDGPEPDLFLIPAPRWEKPDGAFVDRNYEERKSSPEYGINVSRKTIPVLDGFRFPQAIEDLFCKFAAKGVG